MSTTMRTTTDRTRSRAIRYFAVACLAIQMGAIVSGASRDGWMVYDGFDYRSSALLDGGDGGAGAWKTEWRRSAAGGVVLVEPGFAFTDSRRWSLASVGSHAQIRSAVTAGVFRDFNFFHKDAPTDGERTVFWLSFLARVEGAPFEAGADEMSLQLRAEKDVPLLTIGVMGRLNEWRIRADGLGRHFSRGAEKRPPEALSWIVVRVDVDLAPGAPDAVHLWVNPSGANEPSLSLPNARLVGLDIWDVTRPFVPARVRIGSICTTKSAAEKYFAWDELRMGGSFSDVAPSAPTSR